MRKYEFDPTKQDRTNMGYKWRPVNKIWDAKMKGGGQKCEIRVDRFQGTGILRQKDSKRDDMQLL